VLFFKQEKLNLFALKSTTLKEITFLPTFTVKDIYGNEIKSNNLIGNFIYIQFVNPISSNDIELLKKVYFKYHDYKNFIIIAFVKDFKKFLKNFLLFGNNIFVVREDYEKLKRIFRASQCCESFYIFDKTGKLIKSNINIVGYEEGVKPYLMNILENKKFSISYFIKEGENTKNFKWFKQISDIIMNEKAEYFVISMFIDICMTCLSGQIINKLNELHKLNNSNFFFLTILPTTFTKQDIKNLKNQLRINFKIIIADENLSHKWNQLIKEFRISDLTNIVFLVNKKGEIIKVAEPNCQCFKDFFDFLYKKMGGSK
jgi:hypothetical protein